MCVERDRETYGQIAGISNAIKMRCFWWSSTGVEDHFLFWSFYFGGLVLGLRSLGVASGSPPLGVMVMDLELKLIRRSYLPRRLASSWMRAKVVGGIRGPDITR